MPSDLLGKLVLCWHLLRQHCGDLVCVPTNGIVAFASKDHGLCALIDGLHAHMLPRVPSPMTLGHASKHMPKGLLVELVLLQLWKRVLLPNQRNRNKQNALNVNKCDRSTPPKSLVSGTDVIFVNLS